jgi:uncharacterized protein with gpF-like domain
MKKSKPLRPVHPNAGIQADYRRRIEAQIAAMAKSYVYWIKAQYRDNPPRLAMDATPAKELQRELSYLGKRWEKQINETAPKLARWFARASERRSAASLKRILGDSGMTVAFNMTPTMRDAYEATIAENVGLIKSIAQKYHSDVEGIVMRSVTAGRDLGSLTKLLEARYDLTRARAALIARDQNNKATSVFVRVRQVELGLKAVWLHSHGGKEPRPTHLANSGKEYDPARGWFDPDPKVNDYIWPGTLINCRCVSRSVIKGFS